MVGRDARERAAKCDTCKGVEEEGGRGGERRGGERRGEESGDGEGRGGGRVGRVSGYQQKEVAETRVHTNPFLLLPKESLKEPRLVRHDLV